jgi:membrane-bound metal-dependent hydrolase YbcI (DUF457 family)
MKGISHFITGVAIATFFPEVVHLAQEGSLLPVLGGIGGLLPDTIDFKFVRYWEKFDIEIDPGLEPDADAIADALADAMLAAYEEGKDRSVIAHTIRLGADLWREYAIRFDPEAGEIAVRVGPLVNTGQVPYAGTEPKGVTEAVRQVGVPLVHTYSDVYKVNIFSGPTFRFAREDDKLVVHFLDWHHRWTHSLVLALGVGVLVGAVLGFVSGWTMGLWGAILMWLGFSGHILEDQMGYMGSNLFWPFTHKRMHGLGLIHAGDAVPNFLTVWTSLAVILFNLDRFSAQPKLPQPAYLVLSIGVPWLILGSTYILRKLQSRVAQPSTESMRQAERIAEVERVEMT